MKPFNRITHIMSAQKTASQPETQPQSQPPQTGSKQQVEFERKDADLSTFSGDTSYTSRKLRGSTGSRGSKSLIGVILTWPGCAVGCLSLLLWVLFVLAVPSAMITIGAMYLGRDYCDDDRIAMALVFGGPLWFLSAVTGSVTNAAVALKVVKKEDAENQSEAPAEENANDQKLSCLQYWSSFVHGLITLVEGIWLIVISIFVYQAYEEVTYDPVKDNDFYCNRTLFVFSFALVTGCWVIVGYCLVTFVVWQCVWYFCSSALRIDLNS